MSLNALLDQHDGVNNGYVPEHIQKAAQVVRNRVRALKKLHLKTVAIQAEFYRRVHELETEFRASYELVNKQREQIVNGKYEPAENEFDVKLFSWMDDEQEAKFGESAASGDEEPPKGIPDFWLDVLRSVPGVGEMITEQDEPILRYLTDITVDQVNEPASFTINFYFAENPFFKNSVLTKHYKLSIGPNSYENEVLYDGPSIISTTQCKIEWNEGKNVTEKTIKKKAKSGSNAGRTVVKVVPTESFFSFFSPEVLEVSKDMPEDMVEILNTDFEAGQMIRDTVVDGAVLYYTGESLDDDYDFGGAEDEDEQFGGADDEDDE